MGRTLLSWHVSLARWYEAEFAKELRLAAEDRNGHKIDKLVAESDALLEEIAADIMVEREALYLIDVYKGDRQCVGTCGFTNGAVYRKVLGVLANTLDSRAPANIKTRTIIFKEEPREYALKAFSSLESDNLLWMDDEIMGLANVTMFVKVALDKEDDDHGRVRE